MMNMFLGHLECVQVDWGLLFLSFIVARGKMYGKTSKQNCAPLSSGLLIHEFKNESLSGIIRGKTEMEVHLAMDSISCWGKTPPFP